MIRRTQTQLFAPSFANRPNAPRLRSTYLINVTRSGHYTQEMNQPQIDTLNNRFSVSVSLRLSVSLPSPPPLSLSLTHTRIHTNHTHALHVSLSNAVLISLSLSLSLSLFIYLLTIHNCKDPYLNATHETHRTMGTTVRNFLDAEKCVPWSSCSHTVRYRYLAWSNVSNGVPFSMCRMKNISCDREERKKFHLNLPCSTQMSRQMSTAAQHACHVDCFVDVNIRIYSTIMRLQTDHTYSHRGRNGFSPHTNGSCSIT